MKFFTTLSLNLLAFLAVSFPALAGEPKPTSLGLQDPASPNKERLVAFHDDLLMWIITGISVFVLALLVYVAIRFREKANPEPSKTTHNVPLEIIWTVVPIVILIIIAVPSFSLLYYLDRTPNPEMTLKVSGYQWGWTYSYPDHEIAEFNSDYIVDEELNTYIPDGQGRRLLETYNPIVLPTGKDIQILVTAADVLHSWTVPAFGVKKDAVPGRLNETWVHISKPGKYFGQCSEICGVRHAYMPISLYGVPENEFNQWVECMKGDASSEIYPARACVQQLGFDKYRTVQTQDELASIE